MTRRRFFLFALVGVAAGGCSEAALQPPDLTPAGSVELTAARDTLLLRDTLRLTVVVRAEDASPLPGRAITWASSDPAVLDVSPGGVARAAAEGQAWVTATADGATDSMPLTVRALHLGSVTAGGNFSCGLTVAGEAWCWGDNYWGQLGRGTADSQSVESAHPVPGPVVTPLRFTELALGYDNACGLVTDGTVACWGNNYSGSAGNGTTSNLSLPAVVAGLSGTIQVEHGGDHACALDGAGQARCWGDNTFGQLGDGTRVARLTPVAVQGAPPLAAISASLWHSCGRTAAGATWCWGSNYFGELGADTLYYRAVPGPVPGGGGAQQLQASAGRTCRLTAAGVAECWGPEWFFNGGRVDRVPTVQGAVQPWTSLAVGEEHTCGLTAAGAAWCWGNNTFGQLGDGTVNPQGGDSPPTTVAGGHVFTQLIAGYSYACGLTAAGDAWCWGQGDAGQLGDSLLADSPMPVKVAGGLAFSTLSAGQSYVCGLVASGDAYCWGHNSSGQLGGGPGASVPAPRLVPGGLTFASLATGSSGMSCGISPAGVLSCWGSFTWTLGDGVTTASPVPVPVAGGLTFSTASVGGSDACALTTGGQAYCWGYNGRGVVGDGSFTNRDVPTAVTGGAAYTAIAAGGSQACALTGSGAVECWGNDTSGELGDGVYPDSPIPLLVLGASAYVELHIGGGAGNLGLQCGRTGAGSVDCWPGAGLGPTPRPPSSLPGGLTFMAFTTGGSMGCGVAAGGAAWCWGDNRVGQLGDGTLRTCCFTRTPVAVTGGLSFSALSAGYEHACGLTSGGVAYCWGNGYSGALGDPTTPPGYTPFPVKVAGQP